MQIKTSSRVYRLLSSYVSDLVAHPDKLSVDVLVLLPDVIHLGSEWLAYAFEGDLDGLHICDY